MTSPRVGRRARSTPRPDIEQPRATLRLASRPSRQAAGEHGNSCVPIPRLSNARIAVIGLGYVGLPLAVEFGKKRDIIGFDINVSRIEALRACNDFTLEVSDEEIRAADRLRFTCELSDLTDRNVYIVTVPKPIDAYRRPDLTHLVEASNSVGKLLKAGDIVIYESTVYPGSTEEICVPVLERVSTLTFNKDFFAGYSPERINPGDKLHRVATIKKITSGSTPETADFVDALYREIVTAGTHKAPSIKVAEAAKVIENTQRDLNIALVNELAIIFNKMNIDTERFLRRRPARMISG
jgi:UDP-N-acetyl-D-glucosamine/UDP-N-acetyl-D-galactosamine dehydrogenase